MTTAEVFARYLGLTPEDAPWAYHIEYVRNEASKATLIATSPLAPEPTPGWLEVMLQKQRVSISPIIGGFNAVVWATRYRRASAFDDTHPTHAVARALIASDPALRSACERAADYNEKETTNV